MDFGRHNSVHSTTLSSSFHICRPVLSISLPKTLPKPSLVCSWHGARRVGDGVLGAGKVSFVRGSCRHDECAVAGLQG